MSLFNDGTLTQDQLIIQEMAHDFAEKELRPISAQLDEEDRFPMDVYKKACKMGISMLEMPTEYGGAGANALTGALVAEEMSWGDAGFGSSLGAHGIGMKPLLLAGTKEQRGHFAEIANAGGISAFSLTEPDAGSDVSAIKTSAKLVGDEYIINGRKCFCTNAEFADIFTVFATVDKSLGVKGITAFTVDRDTPGLSVGKAEQKMGQRSSITSDVVFEDMKIPVKNRIGEEGQGFAIAMKTLDGGRANASAGAVGLGRAAIEHCVRYSQERHTMGKPIGKHQGLRFILADMATSLEAARQLAWYACRLLDSGSARASEVGAMSKCFSSDAVMQITTNAIQIFGGYGYSREYPVEKLFRDAKLNQIIEGTNQIQRIVIGSALKNTYK